MARYYAPSMKSEERVKIIDGADGGEGECYDSSDSENVQVTRSSSERTESAHLGSAKSASQNTPADPDQRRIELRPFCVPKCCKAYYADGGESGRVTPFAVVLLIILLAVYVLNQADRLVLPVVIPDGLRCDVEKDACETTNNATNTSDGLARLSHVYENQTHPNTSDKDCIDFSDNEQGLLTG